MAPDAVWGTGVGTAGSPPCRPCGRLDPRARLPDAGVRPDARAEDLPQSPPGRGGPGAQTREPPSRLVHPHPGRTVRPPAPRAARTLTQPHTDTVRSRFQARIQSTRRPWLGHPTLPQPPPPQSALGPGSRAAYLSACPPPPPPPRSPTSPLLRGLTCRSASPSGESPAPLPGPRTHPPRPRPTRLGRQSPGLSACGGRQGRRDQERGD